MLDVRTRLRTMAPKRAVAYIRSFELPEDEETSLILCDVKGKSRTQAASEMNVSEEVIKRNRARAFSKILDQLNNAF